MNPLLAVGLAYGAYRLLTDRPRQRKAKTAKPASRKRKPKVRAEAMSPADVERAVCAKLRKKHIGGPGRPDCEGDVEVKAYKRRKVNAHDVEREARKGRRAIVSPFTGFTDGGKRKAARRGVKLPKVRL